MFETYIHAHWRFVMLVLAYLLTMISVNSRYVELPLTLTYNKRHRPWPRPRHHLLLHDERFPGYLSRESV